MLSTKPSRSRKDTHRQRGFSLIELMMALLIMGLIMSVVYKVFSSQDRFFRNQEQIASMQENLRATVEYINQEMSWLGYRVPGIAVIKAAPADIIFKANIPNSGTTIQYVRYQFDPSTNTIRRAAGADESFVENADLTVMASDIEAMAISYYNVLNGVVMTSASDPLCADELSAAVCAPGDPDDDSSLLMIQRVKARLTARTSKPDWMYTDPEGGPNPNFRKRRAVLDLRARNIEDVTLQGGQITAGTCGYLEHTITIPTPYKACADKLYYQTNYRPDPANNTFDDNPSITIQAYDMDGNLNTNPNQVTYVYAVADDGTPYNIYDSSDPWTVDNTIANGDVRYLSAQDLSTVGTGTQVELRFAYSDGLCTQVSYEGDAPIIIAANPASYFYSGGTFVNSGLSLDYVDNGGSPITLATPGQVAMCSSVGNERVLLGAQLNDDCSNPIPGETFTWSDGGFGGSFVSETDNGDGTYSATYVPPDSMGSVASVYTATLGAQWGSFNPAVNVDLIAADAHDIVIDSIVDVTQAGIFQFASNVLPRASQLGGNSGNNFTIERVDGQEVEIRFHVEDACGNRVFKNMSINHSATKGNVSSLIDHGDGSYSFVWESNIGCGLEQFGETITISTTAIANPSTQSETISFDLLTTNSSPGVSGPFVQTDKSPSKDLQAGNTSDFVTVQAQLLQYDEAKQYCTNILAGSMSPFTVLFTLTGDNGGNGSFSPVSPFNDDSESVNTDVSGIASVAVYSGTADWNDTITLTADIDVQGATYSHSIALPYTDTIHPQDDSGFYQDSLYTTEIGKTPDIKAITTFDPGDDLYLQIFDYDENEDPNAQDSFPATDPAVDVFVTVESTLTGDIEEVGLNEELSGNSPKFRRTLSTTFFPAVATTLEKGDGTLQVRDGDTVTMSYEDKDNPGSDFDSWTVETIGADTFRIYAWAGTVETDLFSAGAQVVDVAYGDKLRPKLSLPFLAGDGSLNTDTVRITVDSSADTDIVVLREDGDTGIMMPDDLVLYSGKHFSVAQSDVSDADDILWTPTTPRYVTLEYKVLGSYVMTLSFFMRDYDPPQVTINSPLDGATVSSEVTVDVNVSDVANPGGGISMVELYVNGRLYETKVGADLTGVNTFTWTTAIVTTPYWLDGSHTLTARAYDTSNNEATSAAVGVTLANGFDFININLPAYNSIWSDTVGVQINVPNLPAGSGTHELFLNVNGTQAVSFTVTGPWTFNHTVDTTLLPEGTADLIAIIRDIGTNEYQTTALDFIVDRTSPVINVGSPFNLPWINRAEFPLNPQATITDFKFAPADPNDVNDATVTATFSGACSSTGPLSMSEMPAGSDTYTLPGLWNDPSCVDVEGILTITVQAYDMANPANQASRAFSTRIDTKKPTVNTLTVIPMVNQSFTMGSYTFDGFISEDVTLQATVTDAYPQTGVFAAWFYNDPLAPTGTPDGTQYTPLVNFQNASSGAFTDLWPTLTYPDGIYVLAAGVVDAAGNSNGISPVNVLYLDNSTPWINKPTINAQFTTLEPISGWTVPLLHGLVKVSIAASDQSGFLKEVEHRYVPAGMSPGTAGTPSAFVESWSPPKYSFTANDKKRAFSKSYTLDTCAVTPGTYDVFAYATDWAGNKSSSMGTTRFVVENFTYLVPPSGTDSLDTNSVAYFVEIPPTPKDKYELIGEGTFEDCNGPVNGLDVGLEFYRFDWDGLNYPWPSSTHYTTTTTVLGDFGPISAPQGSWTYQSTHLAALLFDDPVTTDIYAVFHPLFLFNPQIYAVNSTVSVLYPLWYTEFQPYNQERLLTNLTHDLTSTGPFSNSLTVTGDVYFNSGHSAVGESLTIELNWTDSGGSLMSTLYSTATDSSGAFTFTPPADISNSDPFNVQFRRESDYWGIRDFGSIDWDPQYGWSEYLE